MESNVNSTAAFHHPDRETVERWLRDKLAGLAARGITSQSATIACQLQPCLILTAERAGEPPFEAVALIDDGETPACALRRWQRETGAVSCARPTPGFAACLRVSGF